MYEEADQRSVWTVHDRALRTAWDAFDPEFNRHLRHVNREFADVGGAFLVADVPGEDAGVVAIGGFQPLSTRIDSLAEFGLDDLCDDSDDAVDSGDCVELDEVVQIRSVAVDPDWQGQGVGRTLMRELERRIAIADYDHVVLQSPAALTGTRRFYESLGYEVLETPNGDDEYVWFHRCVRVAFQSPAEEDSISVD